MTKAFNEKIHSLGFIEADPKPTEEELSKFYADKYYQIPDGSYSKEYTPQELEYFANMSLIALKQAIKYEVDKSLLDLGCGEGFFAKVFFDANWNVSCCDFSSFGISQHNKSLLPIFHAGNLFDSIKHYRKQNRDFGFINLQNVLEHVLDPVLLLNEMKSILKQEGVIRIRVPNDYSDFQKELLKNNYTTSSWFTPPEHLSYFDTSSLKNILSHCGYEILSIQADFPIEAYLANPHSNYWKDRSLGKGAHLARVFCENYLINKDPEAYIDYTEAAAKLGFGRCLIAYARPLP